MQVLVEGSSSAAKGISDPSLPHQILLRAERGSTLHLSTDEGNSFTATEGRTRRPVAQKYLVWLSPYRESKETTRAENKIRR